VGRQAEPQGVRHCRGGLPSQYIRGIRDLANTCLPMCALLVMAQPQKARRAVPVSMY
jgi:hypothetical protein